MKKTLLNLMMLVTIASGPLANAETRPDLLSVREIEALARGALSAEASALNASLAQEEDEGYSDRQLSSLARLGKTSVDEKYLFDKCIYSESNLVSLLDTELSLEDDAAAARRNNLANVKGLYGSRIWKLVSQACVNAESRFRERLSNLSSRGQALSLDAETINALSALLFYPTQVGRPSFRKSVVSALGTIFTGAVFLGSSGALVGLPVGRFILSLAVPANSLLGLRGALAKSEAAMRSADGLLQSSETVALDLTETESRLLGTATR